MSVLSSVIRHWRFALAMAGRDALTLSRGNVLGTGWLVLRPLLQVGIYVVIVTFIFGARLGENFSTFAYALHILSGLVVWQAAQRAIEEAPMLLRDRMDFIKQQVYPVETLPVTTLLANVIPPAVGLATFLFLALFEGQLSWSVLALPLPVALLALFLLGLSWVFMIVGVIFRDLREIITVSMSFLVYFSPVLVSESMVSPRVWLLLQINPLSHVVICFRDVLQGQFHLASWAIFTIMTLAVLTFGAWLVDHQKRHINEYL
ncbi:hypothetical protein A6A05_00520 [Magnetospirillum moscoviense]|uniref:ABC-2 type transporter transmembrane domain-containing protein n=1 Tax=Magnetospirillum moscoviense TaxID=1437059 RepID=A0A178MYQ3_9PROT|nr:hypothetical protein A6A05_00520 [Magnetospirillum moscoviense]